MVEVLTLMDQVSIVHICMTDMCRAFWFQIIIYDILSTSKTNRLSANGYRLRLTKFYSKCLTYRILREIDTLSGNASLSKLFSLSSEEKSSLKGKKFL